jgi:hypothetical protein
MTVYAYEPFLLCGTCGVTRHHVSHKEPVQLASGRVDFFKLRYCCNACERTWGTETALRSYEPGWAAERETR